MRPRTLGGPAHCDSRDYLRNPLPGGPKVLSSEPFEEYPGIRSTVTLHQLLHQGLLHVLSNNLAPQIRNQYQYPGVSLPPGPGIAACAHSRTTDCGPQRDGTDTAPSSSSLLPVSLRAKPHATGWCLNSNRIKCLNVRRFYLLLN